MAVGTNQGVAGLAPRPFTLGEETGSHHVFMFIAPARSSHALFMLFMLFMQLARSTLVPPELTLGRANTALTVRGPAVAAPALRDMLSAAALQR